MLVVVPLPFPPKVRQRHGGPEREPNLPLPRPSAHERSQHPGRAPERGPSVSGGGGEYAGDRHARDLLYTTYYGLSGYPGVPPGTDAKVAQQALVAPDYLLYNSLISRDFSAYYADTAYSSLPFFVDMKAYRDSLSTFLSATIANSQNPGVSAPSAAADGVITDWVPATSLASTGTTAPEYTVYAIGNGVPPKRISDYAIPLRYAYPTASGNGVLKGVTFSPVVPLQPIASLGRATSQRRLSW